MDLQTLHLWLAWIEDSTRQDQLHDVLILVACVCAVLLVAQWWVGGDDP